MISLLQPGYAPFIAAIGIMIMVGALEGLTLLFGFSATGHAGNLIAHHFEIDSTGTGAETGLAAQFLGWLHIGRVPFLILLVLFLTGFAVSGLLLQSIMQALFHFMLPPSIAACLALPLSLLFVRKAGKPIGRLVPQEESSALSEIDFIGRAVRVVTGEASQGNPAEARFVDEFGQAHYVRIEPDDAGQIFVRGQTVLIVTRVSGSLYRAIKSPRHEL
ncbi:Inner membrane protein YqiJ [Paraburkholderia caffeinitolerans]|uniref:Inner membrane protein YqiJ n=1 Tax=Paraburkholderia caffeinitolerans TaxID=1723730 RepID=A0A6J5GCS4_9BURK|nr:YqiJ family protein [Paraburkholderia caffeinitolerans]CAB3797888.1 Inner membrane protein YqiJ [Paraburkholderia caffeinitolerans]